MFKAKMLAQHTDFKQFKLSSHKIPEGVLFKVASQYEINFLILIIPRKIENNAM